MDLTSDRPGLPGEKVSVGFLFYVVLLPKRLQNTVETDLFHSEISAQFLDRRPIVCRKVQIHEFRARRVELAGNR